MDKINLRKQNIEDILPLSNIQEGILFYYLLGKDKEQYFQQLILTIEQEFSYEIFEQAFYQVIQKNEMLRTIFNWEKAEKPFQIILKDFIPSLKFIDIGDKENIYGSLEEILYEDRKRGLDLKNETYRLLIIKIHNNLYKLIFSYHHILFDGWSIGIIIDELMNAYHFLLTGEKVQEKIKCKYKDFLQYLRKINVDTEKEYWNHKLKDYELKEFIGKDCISADLKDTNIGKIKMNMPYETYEAVNTYIRKENITLASFIYSAWAILLSKYSGYSDILFGTTVSGRDVPIDYIENSVGLYINTIPLRIKIEGKESVHKIIRNVLDELNDRRSFENTSLVDIKSCTSNLGEDFFDSIVVIENYPLNNILERKSSLQIASYDMHENTNFLIVLEVITFNGIEININYHKDIFIEKRIQKLLNHLIIIIEQIVILKKSIIEELEFMSKEEKDYITYKLNNNEQKFANEETVASIFEKMVSLRGNEVAVICGNKKVLYNELNNKSNQLARTLRENGVKPNDIVGLISFRSVEMIIGIIGIMKAGGAYLPINPEYPKDRINYIIDNSKMHIMLVESNDIVPLLKSKIVTYCLRDSRTYNKDNSNLKNVNSSRDLAYVIYTSGSTGKPKGVMIEHISLINRLVWMQKKYPLDCEDVILQKTIFTFDVSIWELILGFFVGAKLCFLELEGEKYPDKIIKEINYNKISVMHFVPSMLNAFLEYIELHRDNIEELRSLKYVFASGEALNVIQVQKFYDYLYKVNGTKLINLYGPTEATIDVTYYDCFKQNNWMVIPIGKPIDNIKIFILGKNNNIQPIGASGELCIAGIGLARGYLNNAELTNQKFVVCPFIQGELMYKTGDIARWNFNEEIEYLGRMDQQIKIRGLRIELGEIEYALMKNSRISNAVVRAFQRINGDNFLCAYIVKNSEIELKEIKHYLQSEIPNYMIPSYFMFLDEIPLCANGKIDNKKLLNPLTNEYKLDERKYPNNNTEKIVLNIWKKVLEMENIGINENFFDIGGNSILMLRVYSMLEKQFPHKIKIIDLFEYYTIEMLSSFIDSNEIRNNKEIENNTEKNEKENRAIAIIGISSKLGGTKSFYEFESILEEESSIVKPASEQRQRDALNYLSALGEETENVKFASGAYFNNIDSFDNEFFGISPNEAKLWDPMQRIFLECAWEAIEDAGYDEEGVKGTKTGVFVGVSSSDIYDYKSLILKEYPSMAGMAVTGNLKPIIASRIAYILDLKGPNMIIDTACSSSLVSLHLACKSISNGESSMAIAGGIKVNILPVERIHKMGIESSDGKTKTFEYNSDGTGDGEGCIALILKPLHKAIRDNNNIYATIIGSAVNQDGNSIGITAPNVNAQTDVILQAWKNAGIDPRTVTYIEAHGTGTKLGDPIEIQGISKAFTRFTEQKQFCAVSSVKTNIGHLDAAAGMAGVIKAIISLKNKKIYSNLHFNRPNRNIEFENTPVYVVRNKQEWNPERGIRRCGVSSFGLSGTNCHIVMEEYILDEEPENQNYNNYIFTVSAKKIVSLKMYIDSYITYFSNLTQNLNIRDVCFTTNRGRTHYKYKIAIIVNSISDLLKKLLFLSNNNLMKYESDWFFTSENIKESINKCLETNLLNHKLDEWEEDINHFILTHKSNILNKLEILRIISKRYVAGDKILWEELYADYKCKHVSLPTYPFIQNRHWIQNYRRKNQQEKIYYKEIWKMKQIKYRKYDSKFNTLVLYENNQYCEPIIEELFIVNNNILEIIIGNEYKKVRKGKYIVCPIQSHFKKVFHEIDLSFITHIVYLAPSLKNRKPKDLRDLLESQEKGIYCMHSMIVELADKVAKKEFKVSMIGKYINLVTNDEETIHFEDAPLVGYMKVLCNEYTNITCQCIDMDSTKEINHIIKEIYTNSKDFNVAYRKGMRFVKELNSIKLTEETCINREIKTDGVYIVFGGGGIGFELAKNLLNNNMHSHILLVGRRSKNCLSDLQSQLMNNYPNNISYIEGDITDSVWLNIFFKNTREEYKTINGIIHCAGIPGSGYIANKTINDFKKVLSAKVEGTWNLYLMTENDDLDFFVLCSSVTTVMGIPGQSDYTAANSFLDSFSEFGKNSNKPIITINWSPWEEVGMALEYGIDKSNIFKPMSSKKAIDIFNHVINSNIERVIVGELNINGNINGKSVLKYKDKLTICLSEDLLKLFKMANEIEKDSININNIKQNGLKDLDNEEILCKVMNIWKEVLGFEQFDMEDNFFEIGGNSIMLVRMQELMKENLNINIGIGELFAYPTLSKLVGFLNSFKDKTYIPDETNEQNGEIHSIVHETINNNLSIDEAIDLFFKS